MAFKKSPPGTKRRQFKKFVKGAGQVGYKTIKAGANLASLARDVKMLQLATQGIKLGLNTEKKYVDKDVFTGTFGQTNGNANGIFMVDVTPSMAQGLGSANRIGNSVKLTGISLPVQFSGEVRTITARKIKMMLFRVSSADNGVTPTEAIQDYYDVNPLNGIIDMNSQRAYRSHKHDGIKLIRSKTYRLPAVSSTVAYNDDEVDDVEQAGFSTKFNVKLQDILRFNANGDTVPDGTRYYLYFFADKGNCSSTTNSSTIDVPVINQISGVRFRLGQRSWYVDN
jgi:hypothetical protein